MASGFTDNIRTAEKLLPFSAAGRIKNKFLIPTIKINTNI